MKKCELIEKIRTTATKILEGAVENPAKYKRGDGADFLKWLITKTNNEMSRMQLSFVNWCYCCEDQKLEALDNEALQYHLSSLERTLADLKEYQDGKGPIIVKMFLTDGDDLVSGKQLEVLERYGSTKDMLGYSVISVEADKLENIVKVVDEDFVYRANKVKDGFVNEWVEIGGDKNE